jgi:hypothetical protein
MWVLSGMKWSTWGVGFCVARPPEIHRNTIFWPWDATPQYKNQVKLTAATFFASHAQPSHTPVLTYVYVYVILLDTRYARTILF